MSNEPRFSNQQDDVVLQQHSTQDWAQWKALLPQLAGLPLLPIGAKPPERKAPVDPSTGYGLENWHTTDLHFTPEQIAAMNGCVIAVGFRTGSDGVLVIDVDGLSALEWLLTHGVNPTEIHTWQIWRTTSTDRFKLVFRLTPEQQALFPNDKILIRFPKRDGQEKGDALEVYYQSGAQVVVAGAHNASGGWYCWRNAPAAVIAPDGTVFAALVALRDERDRRRGLGGGSGGGSKGSTKAAAGEWADSSERRPCPVCGRGHSGACGIHRSGDAVSCYEGATNYPPQPEAGWIPGKTVIGYDGRTWAYIKPDYVAEIGDKRIFKIDQPREQQPAAQSVSFSDSLDDLLGPPPPNTAKAPAIVLTPKQRVAELAAYAEELYASGAAQATRLPLLRIKAKELDIPPYRDQELSRLIWAARRKAQGTSDGVAAGEALNVSPQRWHWEGVLMAGCLNLIVALPKLGKTGLMLAMIAAWHRGDPDFLGYLLIGPCPPVLIVGPDMPENDWATMLKQYGLMGDDNRICEPIVKLYHMGTPIHFDDDGIERITIEAETYRDRGLLILCDSLRKLTAGLGLKEESAEIAEPVHDLMEAVATTGATVALIHHAGKGRAQGSGVEASSGNPALPAAASQVIQLKAVATGDDGWKDPKRILATEGRALPLEALIECVGSTWVTHGSAAQVKAQQALTAAEEKLTDRQADVLQFVRQHCDVGSGHCTAFDVAEGLGFKGSDGERSARRNLQQLERKGLLSSITAITPHGREGRFWPSGKGTGAARSPGLDSPSRGTHVQVSDVSAPTTSPSGSQPRLSVLTTSAAKGSDTSDTLGSPPREGVLSPPLPSEVRTPSPQQPWLPMAQNLRTDGLTPAQIALRLELAGFPGLSGRAIKSALDGAN